MSPDNELQALQQAIARASNATDTQIAYQEFFRKVPTDRINKLKYHSDLEIALQCAYAVSQTEEPTQNSMVEFIGFLEGRTNLRVPMHWKAECVRASRHPLESHSFVHLLALEELERNEIGFLISKQLAIESKEDRFVFEDRSNKSIAQVSKELIQEIKTNHPGLDCLAAYVGARVLILCPYDSFGLPHSVLIVDPQTGKAAWDTKLFGSGLLDKEKRTKFKGTGHYRVYIGMNERHIGVFGCGIMECTLDVVCREDGHRVGRFATNNFRSDHVPNK